MVLKGEDDVPETKETIDLDLGNYGPGYFWRAGETPPGDKAPGEWLVRRDVNRWVVVFRSLNGPEYPIYPFSPTMDGQKLAKNMALRLVDVNWGAQD